MISLVSTVFHLLCSKNYTKQSNYDEQYFSHGFAETALFLQRLGNTLDVRGKSVLDVGCGYGATCIYLAQQGARQVVGIDIEAHRIAFAQKKLTHDYCDLAHKVRFQLVSDARGRGEPRAKDDVGQSLPLAGEKFDIILSKDSFEHIAQPRQFIADLQEHVAEDGIVAIGFGPLWKSPYGGHMSFMTRFPWAHLLFPERVVMQERKRYRPHEHAEAFEQVKGGLNKMTLRTFIDIMRSSKLEPLYFKTNVHQRKLIKVFNALRHIPGCQEYFTVNVYSIWRLKRPLRADTGQGQATAPTYRALAPTDT